MSDRAIASSVMAAWSVNILMSARIRGPLTHKGTREGVVVPDVFAHVIPMSAQRVWESCP
jgi:hypothetical protein